MRTLVLDTNAVLDALLFGNPRMDAALAALTRGELVWRATRAMREELSHVIKRSALHRYSPDCERILTEFDRRTTLIESACVVGSPLLRCRDADDQVFVDLAFHLRPATLLTSDRDLLALARRGRPFDVAILPPARFSSATACAPGATGRTDSRC